VPIIQLLAVLPRTEAQGARCACPTDMRDSSCRCAKEHQALQQELISYYSTFNIDCGGAAHPVQHSST
jgi:hypothetical protein